MNSLIIFFIYSFIWWEAVYAVELHPQGDDFLCFSSNSRVSRTITCSIDEPALVWYVSIGRSISISSPFRTGSSGGFSIGDIIRSSLISESNHSLSARLDILVSQNELPFIVSCNRSDNSEGATYSIKENEPPQLPDNISLSGNKIMDNLYSIYWQTPSTSSENYSVESYILTITPISSLYLPQIFKTNDTSLFVYLNHSTNYTILLKASNCAGDSTEFATFLYVPEALVSEIPLSPSSGMSTDPLSSSAGTSKPPLSSAMFPHSLSIATSSYPKLFPESDTTNMEVLGFTASNDFEQTCTMLLSPLWIGGFVAALTLCCILNSVTFTIGLICGIKYKKKTRPSVSKSGMELKSQKGIYQNVGDPMLKQDCVDTSKNVAYGVVKKDAIIDVVDNVAYSRM